jgi:hypothetical protein
MLRALDGDAVLGDRVGIDRETAEEEQAGVAA